jgi:hypothetical protein
VEIAVLLWVVCGIAAAFIASGRGANGCLWFGLGVLLGPIGLAMSFAAGSGNKCPHCQRDIHPEATRCPHCQATLLGQSASAIPSDKDDVITRALVERLQGQRQAPIFVERPRNDPQEPTIPPLNLDSVTPADAARRPATFSDGEHETPRIRCPKCQTELPVGSRFCGACGVELARLGILSMRNSMKTCPDCAEEVRAAARKCRFCGFIFPELPATVDPESAQPDAKPRPVLRTCSFCQTETLGDEEKCARCGQPFSWTRGF